MEYVKIVPPLPSYYSTSYKGNRVPYHRSAPERYRLAEGAIDSLHYHTCIEVGYCVSGRGECCIEDRRYRFRAGDMQVVMPYRPHYSASDEGVDTRWVWLFLEPYRVLGKAGFMGSTNAVSRMIGEEIGFSRIFHPEEHPRLAAIIKDLDREMAERPPHAEERIALLTYELCIVLARESERLGLVPPPVSPDLVRVMPVFRLIRENLDDNEILAQENLAATCSVSVSHFRRLFTEVAGVSPKAYIVRARMSYAEYLLINTDRTILEISLLSGFDNLSCFSRMFKKIHGLSPSEFRHGGHRGATWN